VRALLGALLVTLAGLAWADPPVRAIRLAYTAGPVSFLSSGESEWVEARVNRPLWTGDRLWSDRGARAELQIGGAALFFAPETSVSILNFDDDRAQFELTQGTVDLYVRSLGGNDSIEIDTPNLAFVVRKPGQYRIDVRPNGESTAVAIERGEGEAFGTRSGYVLRAGNSFRFYGNDLVEYAIEPQRRDAFVAWVSERVRARERSPSARYVSSEMVGYDDLDAYGNWSTVANYGPVWVPSRVDRDWAPYRNGHWSWVDPWGWTWIDDAPWGFAPSHYGRWAYIDNRYWGWVPGPRNVTPVYAPALVAFVGGDNFRLSVSTGPATGVAWFPLAPGEVYRPAYTASREYFTRVNTTNTVINVTNVTNVYNNPTRVTDVRYVNMNNENAVTAVPSQVFVQSQPVQRANVRVDRAALQGATAVGAAPIAPARASVVGAAPATQAKPTQEVMGRQVVAKQAPPPAMPSFDRRQEAMKQQPGKPLDRAEMAKAAPPAAAKPNVTVVQAAPAATPIQQSGARAPRAADAASPAPAPKQPPQAQNDRERPGPPQREAQQTPPPAAAAPAPTPPPAAAKAEPPRPTQAMPAPEQPRAQPPQAQNDRRGPPQKDAQRAPEPPAAAAPPPQPAPRVAAPQPQPQQQAQPPAPRPSAAAPAPEAAPQSPEPQQGRRAARDRDADKGKDKPDKD